MRARGSVVAALLLAACSSTWTADSGAPADSASETAADTSATDPLCDGAADLTWDTFGEALLIESCDGCHAATAPDRHDAPADVTFDTKEQAWAWAPRILARATGDAPTMPPQGGVTDDDRTRLYWWLACGTPGS